MTQDDEVAEVCKVEVEMKFFSMSIWVKEVLDMMLKLDFHRCYLNISFSFNLFV